MKKIIVMIGLVVLSIVITACGKLENNEAQKLNASTALIQNEPSIAISYKRINPVEAKKRLESEKGIILLDVRTEAEYLEKHIPKSILIPVDEIEKEALLKITDKDSIIFVYCRSGRRSAIAAEALVKMGYTHIFDLGGINDWPYETE